MPVSAATDASELFASYHDPIRRCIRRIGWDDAQADDLTQETLLRAYRRGASLRDPEAAVGWLYRIATNVCVDYLRSRRLDASLDDATTQTSPVAHVLSADEIAERAGTSQCVQQCLEHLPDNYRAVLLLFHD